MKHLIILVLILIGNNVFSQLDSIHWIPPIHSYSPTLDHYIYLSTPSPAPFTVTIIDGGGTVLASPTISQGNPFRYFIGTDTITQLFVSDALLNKVQSDKGFILSGDRKFYANVRTQQGSQAGSITAKGRAGAGLDFRVGFMPAFNNGCSCRNNFCSIMATEDNTNVTLTGYDPGVVFDGVPTVNLNSLSFNLNKGETYTFSTRFDVVENRTGLIGSLLSSDLPIVVNTGNFLGTIDSVAGGQDIGIDQIVPIDVIGDEYVSIKGDGSNTMEKVMIVAHENNTSIFLNGSTTAHTVLNAGEWTMVGYNFYQGTTHQNMYIKSSNPVYCFQFLGGSTSTATPGMNILAPISCDLSSRIDAIPSVDSIGSFPYSGGVFIVARNGAFVNVNGVAQTVSEPVLGLSDWVTYKVTGLIGDQVIESDGNIIAGIFGVNAAAGWAGYYSGFDRLPQEVNALSNPVTQDSCGSVLLTVSPAYDSYTWYRDNTLLTLTGDSNIVSQNGDYYVVLTNQFGCNDTAYNDNVIAYTVPIAIAGVDTVLNCWVPAKELNGELSSAGSNFSYNWTTLGGNILSGSTTITPVVNNVGDYILEVTDDNSNCSVFDTLTITIDTISPFVDAGLDTLLTCTNTQIELMSLGNLPNGQFYEWATSDGVINGNNTSTSVTIARDGLYFYTLTDSINGCSSTDSVLVGIDTIKPILIVGEDTLINCYNPSISLSAIGSIVGDLTYQWQSNDGGNIVSGENTLVPLIDEPGHYTLTILNNYNGCLSSDSLFVNLDNQSEAIILMNNSDEAILSGLTLTDYEFSQDGSTGPIEWSINNETKLDSLFTYRFNESGNYFITLAVENILNGCVSIDTLNLILTHELLIPSVVSADGNEINDFFVIKALENYDENQIVIFNRWGNEIFQASPYLNNWGGQSNNGSNVSNGTYFYLLKLIDNGEEFLYKGSIELKRN